MLIETIIFIFVLAIILSLIDSAFGAMYGTLLSPILLIMGFEPLHIIPAILISQAIGGIGGTISHHYWKNMHLFDSHHKLKPTRDMKVCLAMIIPGLFVIVLGVLAAVNIPPLYVKIYIGLLVMTMSALVLSKIKYTYALWKQVIYGVLAAFNKALTGGGFGPVTSTGGIIGGLEPRVSIATTTMAEVFISGGSFVAYYFISGNIDWFFCGILCIGAIIGGFIGPYISSIVSHDKLRKIIGIIGIISGVWLLFQVLNIL